MILLVAIAIALLSYKETNPLVGTWKGKEVTYKLYSDSTGEVFDKIEGDSIRKWWIKGDKLFLKVVCPYDYQPDSLVLKIVGKNEIKIEGFKFRKIGNS